LPGQSGNPAGRPGHKGVRIAETLLQAFRDMHQREPSPVESVQLATAGKLLAKAQAPNVNVELASRASNTAIRFLISLGLHSKKPARMAAPSRPYA